MEMIKAVWNFVSNTGVNSVLTFASIVLAIIALSTAKSAKKKLEEYSRNLKTNDFLRYVENFCKLNNSYSVSVMKIKDHPQDWNKAGEGTKIMNGISDAVNGINKFYETISIPEDVKNEYKELDKKLSEIITQTPPTMTQLNDIRIQISKIDKKLNKIAADKSLALFSPAK